MNLPKSDVADGGFFACWAPWTEKLSRPVKADVPRVFIRCPQGHVHAIHAPASTHLVATCPVRSCGWTASVALSDYEAPATEIDPTTRGLAGESPQLQFLPPYSVEQLEAMGYVAP